MTATSVCVPRGSSSCPLPLWETLKDHKFRKYYIGIVYFWDCLRFKFGAVLSSTVIPPCPALSCSGDPQPSTLSWTRDLGPPEADDPPFDSSPHFLSSHHEGTASSQVGCPQWRLYPSLTWGCLCTHTFLLPGVHPAVYPVAGWKFERGQSNLVTPDVSWNLNQAIPRVVLTNSYSFMPCYILLHLICRMKKIPEETWNSKSTPRVPRELCIPEHTHPSHAEVGSHFPLRSVVYRIGLSFRKSRPRGINKNTFVP
uniref:Uncharacterized protein LOC123619697 n=1 Tax=Camelus bactrianus TaxID=9837 RepID=A0A9W3GJN8_CAMBA|nr:uncharacterized protein LOC123619697 [Camelus bactrianus]